jgi:hypothetical protein
MYAQAQRSRHQSVALDLLALWCLYRPLVPAPSCTGFCCGNGATSASSRARSATRSYITRGDWGSPRASKTRSRKPAGTACMFGTKAETQHANPSHAREIATHAHALCTRGAQTLRTARVQEKPTHRIPLATSMKTTVHLHGCPQSQPYICAHGCRDMERTCRCRGFQSHRHRVTWRRLHA